MTTTPIEVRRFTKGDRLASVYAWLRDARTRGPVNLTDNTITFRMVSATDQTVKIAGATASILSPATAGAVQYNWAANDVDTAGTFWAWFIRTSGGQTEHFPVGHAFMIEFVDTV